MSKSIRDSIMGALYGVATGDALGAPVEFMDASKIERRHGRVTKMIGGGWLNVRPGEVTDDTHMTLAVAEGIVADPDNPIEEIGARFIEWYRSGPKDVGGTCSASINKARVLASQNIAPGRLAVDRPTGEEWFEASYYVANASNHRSGGNGALMRTVYPGLFYRGELMAVETASAIAQMTHCDEASNEAVELYTRMVWNTLNPRNVTDRESWIAMILRIAAGTRYDAEGLDGFWRCGLLEPSGWSVNSMKCALATVLHTCSFEEAVTTVVNMGGDADTIGAITGGLAGAFYGFDAIPSSWIAELDPEIMGRLNALADAALANLMEEA